MQIQHNPSIKDRTFTKITVLALRVVVVIEGDHCPGTVCIQLVFVVWCERKLHAVMIWHWFVWWSIQCLSRTSVHDKSCAKDAAYLALPSSPQLLFSLGGGSNTPSPPACWRWHYQHHLSQSGCSCVPVCCPVGLCLLPLAAVCSISTTRSKWGWRGQELMLLHLVLLVCYWPAGCCCCCCCCRCAEPPCSLESTRPTNLNKWCP